MPDGFVHSDGDVYSEKRDVRTAANEATAVTAANLNSIRTAFDDIRDYLQAGVFDASDTVTLPDTTIPTATMTTATITNATVSGTATITHIDAIADQSPSVGPEIDWKGQNARWFVGVDVANAPTSRDFVLTGVRGSYSFPDGATTATSTTLTSASGGGFVSALIGASISGTGIPNGTTITAVGGLTSLTMSAAATITDTNVRVSITRNSVQDILYLKHRGGLSPTIGLGVTPPDGTARVQISPQDDEPTMGTLRLRRGPSQTGKVLALHDSAPTDMWWVDKDFYVSGVHGAGGAVAIKAPNDATGRALLLAPFDLTTHFSFDFPTASGNVLRVRNATNNQSSFEIGTNGSLRHLSSNLGFFGASVTTKPTITGSRSGATVTVLTNLLTALATLGLITDSTTA